MDLFYQTYIAREDQIYQSMPRRKPISGQVDPPELEFGVDWLCHGAHSVLDFGCGNGSLLFACAYRGVERLVGSAPMPISLGQCGKTDGVARH